MGENELDVVVCTIFFIAVEKVTTLWILQYVQMVGSKIESLALKNGRAVASVRQKASLH